MSNFRDIEYNKNSLSLYSNIIKNHINNNNIISYNLNNKYNNIINNDKLKVSNTIKKMLGTSLGGIFGLIFFQPLFVLKVKIQTSLKPINIKDAFLDIKNNEGIKGFYRGTTSTIVQNVPNTVIYMITYDILTKKFNQITPMVTTNRNTKLKESKSISSFLSGIMARFIAVISTAPLDLIRTCQSNGEKLNIKIFLNEIKKNNNIKILYQGSTSTLLRDCTFSGLFWPIYEMTKENIINIFYTNNNNNDNFNLFFNQFHLNNIKKYFYDINKNYFILNNNNIEKNLTRIEEKFGNKKSFFSVNEPNNSIINPSLLNTMSHRLYISIVSGILGSIVAGLITHPFDVIKTYSQITAKENKNLNSLQSCKKIFTLYGLRGFYKGLIIRFCSVVPSSTLLVAIYEYVKHPTK